MTNDILSKKIERKRGRERGDGQVLPKPLRTFSGNALAIYGPFLKLHFLKVHSTFQHCHLRIKPLPKTAGYGSR
jgi:hypothetical protein